MLQEKEEGKVEKHIINKCLFRSWNAFRRRIPQSSSTRKEPIDTNIFVTSRNGDRKITKSIRITRGPCGSGTSSAS